MGSYDSDEESSLSEGAQAEASFKSSILRCILNVKATGSFATFDALESFVNPGISVEKVGPIRLPLSKNDAKALVRVSRKAPFGKGRQTLVDDSVRKTWEIDPSQVVFSNKAWQACIGRITRQVSKELGVAGGPEGVRADFYKMLLYEQGAMFKAHKDAEKSPGMFGTLVISLPSEHKGGDVILKHKRTTLRYSTADYSSFNAACIAWYADVSHEIEPVQSGYRWVLAYNLINTSMHGDQSASRLGTQIATFARSLQEWKEFEDLPALCFDLGHQYTDAELRLVNLKGDDYHQARLIVDGCKDQGDFIALFANLERKVEDLNSEETRDDHDSWPYITRLVDADGWVIAHANEIYLQDRYLLRGDDHKDRDPDNQYGGEYCGNSYSEIHRFYRDTAVVMIPAGKVADFLLGTNPPPARFESFLELMRNRMEAKKSDQSSREYLIQACQLILPKSWKDAKWKDNFLGPIALTAFSLEDMDLLTKAIDMLIESFDPESYKALGATIGLDFAQIPTDIIDKSLTKSGFLHQTHSNIRNYRAGVLSKALDGDDDETLDKWVRGQTLTAVKASNRASTKDASTLLSIVSTMNADEFDDLAKPYILRFIHDQNFCNELMFETLCKSRKSGWDDCAVVWVFPIIASAASSDLLLNRYISKNNIERLELLPSFYKRLHEFDNGQASRLLKIIADQIPKLSCDDMSWSLSPLLKGIMSVCELSSPECNQFVSTAITYYIDKAVGEEPVNPQDWARPEHTESWYCWKNCEGCHLLKAFLLDPQEESKRFVVQEPYHFRGAPHKNYFLSFSTAAEDPPSITVTKTDKFWKEKHDGWVQAAKRARELVTGLPPDSLKKCLGNRYDDFKEVCVDKILKKSAPAYVTSKVVPQKRRRE